MIISVVAVADAVVIVAAAVEVGSIAEEAGTVEKPVASGRVMVDSVAGMWIL